MTCMPVKSTCIHACNPQRHMHNNHCKLGMKPLSVYMTMLLVNNPHSQAVWAHGQGWQTDQYGHMAIHGRKKREKGRRQLVSNRVACAWESSVTPAALPFRPQNTRLCFLFYFSHSSARLATPLFALFLPRIAMCPYWSACQLWPCAQPYRLGG